MELEYYQGQEIVIKVKETEDFRQLFIAFNALNGELKEDGNQWCAITGQMPEHYLAGFADTPKKALENWWMEFWNNKIKLPQHGT